MSKRQTPTLDALQAPYQLLFQTAASTGLRLGELLRLQWGDVDHGRRQFRVRRTLYCGQYYTPKTRRSKRDVDAGPQLLGALRALAGSAHGGAPAPAAPIFTTAEGALIDPDNLRQRVWAPALRAAELRHVRIHSLRHFYASALIAQGESIKYVSSQLGHASAQITIDRYGHLFPNEKRTSADRLQAMLAASEGGRGRASCVLRRTGRWSSIVPGAKVGKFAPPHSAISRVGPPSAGRAAASHSRDREVFP